jgi:hypothetical protein
MKITWDDLKINFNEAKSDRLVEDWRWLIGQDKTPIMVSSIGDLFLRDNGDKIYWLDVGQGQLTKVADRINEFQEKLQDKEQVSEWFLVELIAELKNAGNELKEGQIYSFKKLPILGGDYSVDNFEITDIEVHFSFAGQLHKQVRDLPDGTKINEVRFTPDKN